MSDLSLYLMGSFEAILGGAPLEKFRTNKVQALLIYLAAEPITRHRRDELMNLMWPGLPSKSAQANLRQVIYHLRKAVPDLNPPEEDAVVPLLQSEYRTVSLNPVYPLEVDTKTFIDLLSEAQAHEHSHLLTCEPCQKLLKDAADLYRGPFLADFWLDDSDLFEDWALAKRETYRRQVLDALETLTTAALRSGAHQKAEAFARRQLEIDDLRESAHRQLMEALARSGRKEEALAQYERCQRQLRKELGMAPSARTTAFYGRIAAGEVDLFAPVAPEIRGYELLEEIGAGAFGAVHKAYQPAVDRQVAVKIILPQYANQPEFIRRFEVEAQTVARLEHPYIVPLYDYWREPNGAYLVMRYLQGGSLSRSLAAGESWTGERAVQLVEQVASALDAAHGQGLVHRDIKPANILLDQEGNAYLSDFGIAKDILEKEGDQGSGDGDQGSVTGSPAYISPEQILDEPVTAKSDIYSLGLVMYELLTGEVAYPEESLTALLHQQLNEPVPLLMEELPELPADVDVVIQRATAKRPADRYADALELARAFREAMAVPITAPVPWLPAAPDEELVNPYKGLRAFQEADASDFFGREALVSQLIDRMGGSSTVDGLANFLAVVGPSGSGKSSAVKAGLIPALRAGALSGSDKWFIVEMALGRRPLEELEAGLLPVAVDPPASLLEPLQKDERGLIRTLKRILPTGDGEASQLLLVLDQFEELFTLVENEEERTHFINSLLTALEEPRSPLRVLVTLRADFYDRPLAYQKLGELLRARTELVLPMNSEELERAICEPAEQAGAAVDPGLVASIISDVQEQPGMLPLLQYALTELFERRQDGILTQEAYREIGGVAGALGRRAEEIYENLDNESQSLTRQIFLRLVTLGEGIEDTRRRVLRSELEALFAENSNSKSESVRQAQDRLRNPKLSTVLDSFGSARLLTFDRDPSTREPTVEVAHEALLREWERLRGWMDESRADVRLQRLLGAAALEWLESEQDPGYLLRGSRLTQFEDWTAETDLALTGNEREYLEASLAERRIREATEAERQAHEAELERRSRNRLRAMVGIFAVAAVIAVALSIFAFDQQNAAQENEALAVQGQATATVAQGEALFQASTAEAERIRAEEESLARATQQAVAEHEVLARATAQSLAEEQRIVAVEQRAIAEEQTSLTTSRELAIQSQLQQEKDPDRSLLLAMQAMDAAKTSQAASALHAATMNHRLARTIKHPEEIGDLWGVVFSPDGKEFATAGFDGTIRVWDFDAGEELISWQGHDDRAWFITYSSDGTLLATSGSDDMARVWDAETGLEIFSVATGVDYAGSPVAISPNGTLFASPAAGGIVKVWDLSSSEELFILTDDGGDIKGVAFSPDGLLLATIGDSNQLRIWDAETGAVLLNLENDLGWSELLKFSPDGTYLVANGDNDVVRIWNIPELIEKHPDSGDTPLSKTELFSLSGNDVNVVGASFSPDEQFLVAGSQGGTIKMWDLTSGEELLSLVSRVGAVNGVAVSQECEEPPDFPFEWCGRYLISSHGDGTLQVWDISPVGNQEVATIRGGFDSIFNQDGSQIVTYDFGCKSTGCWISSGDVWGLPENKPWEEYFSQESAHSQLLSTFELPEPEIAAVGEKPYGWNEDHAKLGIVYSDKEFLIYDSSTGEILSGFSMASHPGAVQGLAFSPDDKLIATGDDTGIVKVWDASTGNELSTLSGHLEMVEALDFDSDGDHLVTTSRDGIAKIWDLQTEEELHTLTGHTNWVRVAAFSPDGTTVATGSRDTTVRIWDVSSGEELYKLSGHTLSVYDLDFSPDGTMLASGVWGASGAVNVWETSSGRQLLSLRGPDGRNIGLKQFSPDGTMLLVDSEDSESTYLHVLLLPEELLLRLAQSKLTRWFTTDECQQFLHLDQCPDPP